MKSHIIHVRQADIDRGKKDDVNHCPVAIAIREQVRDCTCVKVYATQAQVQQKGQIDWQIADLTRRMTDWIDRFNHNRLVGPIKFMLKIPD